MSVDVEVHADGGIRLTGPDGKAGLATLEQLHGWITSAARSGTVVRASGAVESPMGSAVLRTIERDGVDLHVEVSEPQPWPRGRTSLQTAAASGLDTQARDLVARGASMKARRRDETPYRLAMRRGHIPVLRSLRDAGARQPPGSRPPASLPDAVVLRLYAQAFVWWIAGGVAAVCVAIAIVARVWPLLVVAPIVMLVVLIRNWTMGWFRLAIDGPLICVRHLTDGTARSTSDSSAHSATSPPSTPDTEEGGGSLRRWRARAPGAWFSRGSMPTRSKPSNNAATTSAS